MASKSYWNIRFTSQTRAFWTHLECSDDLKPKHGIDLNKIHNCAKDENLSKDFEIMSELKINTDPTVVLNGAIYPGYIDGEDLFNWICTSFSASPKICS